MAKTSLSSQAFACLQHGFLRTVENVNIHNFVTPKWLCLIVSMAVVTAGQMLFALFI